MSLSCLIDHIGIEGCSQDTPVSGLYINRLPGIELKALDKVATNDQANFTGVWDDVQERAVRRLRNEANAEFKKRYKLKTITQSVDVEKKIDASTTTASAASYRGYVLELNKEEHNYVASNLQGIYIQTLPLYLSGAVNTTVKIWDLDTKTELFTLAVTGALGWNTVRVDETFTARRIYVAYDATNVTSVEQDITKLRQAVLYHNHETEDEYHCLCYSWSNLNIEIRGATSTIADKFTITYGEDTFGLSGIFSVLCSYDALICNNLTVFETALWYLLASEFCFERQFTSRINEYTAFDKNKAKDLKEEYEKRYMDELEVAIGGIDLDLRDLCLVCNDQFRHADARI